jgi:hypothetical protein
LILCGISSKRVIAGASASDTNKRLKKLAAFNALLTKLDFIHMPISPCRGAAFDPSPAFMVFEK